MLIETKRLRIRPWTADDVPHYLRLANDVGYNTFTHPMMYYVPNEKESLEKIRPRITLFEKTGLGKFLVFCKETNEFAGTCGAEPYSLDGNAETELGYRFCLKHWGKGYATEAAIAIRDYAFKDLNHSRLIAFALHQNTASLKIIEKIGFVYSRDFTHLNLPHKLFRQERTDWIRNGSL